VSDWLDSSSSTIYDSYASSYAFGAYLARNYGGAALIKAIASNSDVNETSITDALSISSYAEKTFKDAFARYNEALVFSTSGFADGKVPLVYNTFDRTATNVVNGHTYVFPAFDLWRIVNRFSDGSMMIGPGYYPVNSAHTMRPYGLDLQSAPSPQNPVSWQDVTGDLSVYVTKPTDSNVSLYLMVRTAN